MVHERPAGLNCPVPIQLEGRSESALEVYVYAPREDRPALLYVTAAVVYWLQVSGVPFEFKGELTREDLPLGAQLLYLSDDVIPPQAE